MIENSDMLQRATFRREGRAPCRVRTLVAVSGAVALGLLFFISAFGSMSVILPAYGFFCIGEGRVALKLPEKPQGLPIQRSGPERPGTVYFGRNWPFAQRYYIGGDPIGRRVDSGTGRRIDPQNRYLFWNPDVGNFPAFSSWPLWMPAALFAAIAVALRTSEVRRWRKAECCPHCSYSLEGLEVSYESDAVCPECGGTLAHTREARETKR